VPREEIDPNPDKDNLNDNDEDRNNAFVFSMGATSLGPVLSPYKHIWERQPPIFESGLRRRRTVSVKMDDINIKRFHKFESSEPIARHKHSNFAVMQFSSMVIGRIKESSYNKQEGDAQMPFMFGQSFFRPQQPYFDIDLRRETSVRVFKRYQMIEKELVNGNLEQPVIKFTFRKIHQLRNPSNDRFLPGDYIEIQARVKGQVVIRAYTPTEGRMSRTFSIIVKIYDHGLMSQYLANQRIGYELKVRGPFDLADRAEVTHYSQNELSAIMGRQFRRAPSIIRSTRSSATDVMKKLLMNPNSVDGDGCWDELYMIAGGSGITPMLQVGLSNW
jgi:hypothetical protein